MKVNYGLTQNYCTRTNVLSKPDTISNPQEGKNYKTDLNLNPQAILNRMSFSGSAKKDSAGVFVEKFLKTENPVESARLLLTRYPELGWLTGAVNATPADTANASKSVSEALFGKQHIEFDRTLTGIEALKWVLKGDYEQFTKCQNNAVKLTRENFDYLREYTQQVLPEPEDIDTMIGYTVINDLGKIRSVVNSIQEKTGIQSVDHDDILLYALKHTPDEIPTFKRLSQEHRDIIVRSLEPQFNLGQFVQAENLPANLSGLKKLDSKALDYYLIHTIYDVAGAAGHVNPDGSLVMSNPVYEGYKQGIESVKDIINGKSEVAAYKDFLKAKAEALGMKVETPKDMAVMKLAVLSRAANTDEAQTVRKAFESLDSEQQTTLITQLNKTGIDDKGILLYYAPAFIQNLKASLREQPEQALSKGFSVLAELYNKADKMTDKSKGVFTVLISDIARVAKEEPHKLSTGNILFKSVGDNAEAFIE